MSTGSGNYQGEEGLALAATGMWPLRKDFCFVVLQILKEQGLHETAHSFERDSKVYFDTKYFEELILAGRWAEAEWYLRGYVVDIQGCKYALKLMFEIYKQQYYEALYSHERVKAYDILRTKFKLILTANQDIYQELLQIFFMNDFREHPCLKEWGSPEKTRAILCATVRNLVPKCPHLKDKLYFPAIPRYRLFSLIRQSVNWQHFLCKRKLPNVSCFTLFKDHDCSEVVPSPFSNATSLLRSRLLLPSSTDVSIRSAVGPSAIDCRGKQPIDVRGVPDIGESPRRKNKNPDAQCDDSTVPAKKFCASEPSTYAELSSPQILAESSDDALRRSHNLEELPTSVVMALQVGSSTLSMDFNPIQQTLLLVGTSLGEISLWDLVSKEMIHQKSFGLVHYPALSTDNQDALDEETGYFPVKRVLWSSDGCHFAVAYSKHIVRKYKYNDKSDLICDFEIEAHKGVINDLAFSRPMKMIFLVTCGDDGAIRVWTGAGTLVHTFSTNQLEPILSICPQLRGNYEYILSYSGSGKVKSWRYDQIEAEHEYDGPLFSSVSLAPTTDGSRLFSCGRIKSRTKSSLLAEWNVTHRHILRYYTGLSDHNDGILHFDMANDNILAAGDDSRVKFWNVNETKSICFADAGGGLPMFPRIRFNKSGSLLAVSANDNFIKILASKSGQEMLPSSHQSSTSQISVHIDDPCTS